MPHRRQNGHWSAAVGVAVRQTDGGQQQAQSGHRSTYHRPTWVHNTTIYSVSMQCQIPTVQGRGHLRKRNCPTLRKILQWHSYVRQGHRCRKIVTIKQMPDNTCSSMRSSLLRRPDRNRDPTLSVTPAYHQNLMFFFRSPCATFPPNFNENRLIFFCVIPLTNKQTSM